MHNKCDCEDGRGAWHTHTHDVNSFNSMPQTTTCCDQLKL
jgi:hypothetical protein